MPGWPIHGPGVSIVFQPDQGPMLLTATCNVHPQPDAGCHYAHILPAKCHFEDVVHVKYKRRAAAILVEPD